MIEVSLVPHTTMTLRLIVPLSQKFGDMQVNINQGITMGLADYFSYSGQAVEENPMYLFDSEFGEKRPDMLADYRYACFVLSRAFAHHTPLWLRSIPKYFQEDYFSYLDEPHRPSFRWILVGPTRSGAYLDSSPD